MTRTPLRALGALSVAAATAVVLVAVAVLLFFNPVWVAFEQDRTGAPALLGFTPDQTRAATNAILAEFVFGPGTFAVQVNGAPVLNERERQHMADVRRVVLAFAAIAVGAAVLLLAAWRRAGTVDGTHASPRSGTVDGTHDAMLDGTRTGWYWRAVAAGAGTLAAVVIAAGAFAVLLFDQAFEFFHRLLFPAGSYTFDPTSERLVQLFPMTFWFETTTALAVVLVALSIAVAAYAVRRLPGRSGSVAAPAPVARAT